MFFGWSSGNTVRYGSTRVYHTVSFGISCALGLGIGKWDDLGLVLFVFDPAETELNRQVSFPLFTASRIVVPISISCEEEADDILARGLNLTGLNS